MIQYFETNLWKKAEEAARLGGHAAEWQFIANEFKHIWHRATQVAARIAEELPQLTLHDEFHLNAVFEMGSQIAGIDYELTPMEVIAFGVAVAIHDLAHTTTAYEGGLASIKATDEWKDAVLQLLNLDLDDDDPSPDIFDNPSTAIHDTALFITLRKLHAKQAERLLGFKIQVEDERFYLMKHEGLRSHFGPTIGKIAASHHWGYERLVSEFSFPIGETFDTTGLGEIRPLVVACLLRTADACQIDQRRAFDRAKTLHRPEGVSLDHWQAQNQLAIPVKGNRRYGSGLLFNSTKAFGEDRIRSWWTAWDLVGVADRELRGSNRVLVEQGEAPFAMDHVVGAGSPLELSQYIQVENWTPLESKIKISDPEHVVQILAGPALYGQNLWAPLRELLQNSADAIRARRQIDQDFRGRILVRVVEGKWEATKNKFDISQQGTTIQIYDDGIGMSLSQIRDYLLDFGASLKVGPGIKLAFPKLLGKRVPSVGKFGIGFFSTSMISDSIWVRSRRYDAGLEKNVLLCFRDDGLESPFVFDGHYDLDYESYSTIVSLFLDEKTSRNVRSVNSAKIGGHFSWEELICFLAPCLEVDIFLEEKSTLNLVHSQDWSDVSFEEWMNKHYVARSISHYLNSWSEGGDLNQGKHEFKGRAGLCTGLATLSNSLEGSGFFVEGGLRVLGSSQYVHESFPFHGAIPISTRLASRQGGLECMSQKHKTSLEASIRHEPPAKAPRQVLCNARNRTFFGFDIANVKCLQVNGETVSCRQVVMHLLDKKVLIFPFEPSPSYPRARMYMGQQNDASIEWKKNVVVLRAHHLFTRHECGQLVGLTKWIETSNQTCVSGAIVGLASDEGYSVEARFFNGTVVGESEGEDVFLPGVELSLMSIVQIPGSEE